MGKKRPISAGNSVNDDAFRNFLLFYLFISIILMLLSFHLTLPHVRMYTYKNTYKYEYVVRLMCFSFLIKIVKNCQIQYGANHEYSLRFYNSMILVACVFLDDNLTLTSMLGIFIKVIISI